MVLFTVAVAGLVSLPLASPDSGWKLVHAMFGLLLVSASGCALNQYLERYVDWLMPRTARRPLPDLRLSAVQVAVFGAVTCGVGMAWLLALVNWQTAVVAGTNWLLYVWIYTPLKLKTWLNTYVGAVAGALPVLVGSTAVCGGQISAGAWLLFLVLFLWQFPHFMAIAWLYRDDYLQAAVRMATTVDPSGRLAAGHAVLFCVALIPVTVVALWPAGIPAAVLLLLALLLAGWYLKGALGFWHHRDVAHARVLFRISLAYLTGYLVLLSLSALV
jgi:protoheme IX farnesyltransferase